MKGLSTKPRSFFSSTEKLSLANGEVCLSDHTKRCCRHVHAAVIEPDRLPLNSQLGSDRQVAGCPTEMLEHKAPLARVCCVGSHGTRTSSSDANSVELKLAITVPAAAFSLIEKV